APTPCTECDGACVDLQNDSRHCGRCGAACESGSVCRAGACTLSCQSRQTACGGRCVDTTTDTANCGACGRACPGGEACQAGQCAVPCASGLAVCGGRCVDTAADTANCGACGVLCPEGQACKEGRCLVSCVASQRVCGDRCVSVQTDPAHCGQCDRPCPSGALCQGGACQPRCVAGQQSCDGGACFNPRTDNANCGGCGIACAPGRVCSNGVCGVSCSGGLTTCAGDGGVTVCVDGQVDPQNCGGCGATCADGQVCRGGSCASACGAGQTLCNQTGQPYCAPLSSDNANCGACGTSCAMGEACVGGSCSRTCAPPQVACPVDGGSPVCANTAVDLAHCGACGAACGAGQACVNGTCQSQCGAGTTVCPRADGGAVCTTLTNDALNCGQCGLACPGGCVAGFCPAAPSTLLNAPLNLSTANLAGRTCAQGGEMVRYQVTALTPRTATVTPAPAAGCLAVGDELLLINLQGTATASGNVGNSEFVRVAQVAGATITFAAAKTRFYGDGASDDANLGSARTNQRVMLQRVPVFDSLILGTSAQLTAEGWDGGAGGVFALRATTRIQSQGAIDMRGKGYAGAAQTTTVNATGSQGEGVTGLGAVDDGPSVIAGGGGRGDSRGCPATQGSAAGGGGHATWGARASVFCGGHGGAPVGSPDMVRLFLGGGGGSGGTDNTLADNPPGGAGGRGGGIVLLLAPVVELAGTVDVRGTDGEGDPPGTNCRSPSPTNSTTSCWDNSGPGGGGAGGSFFSSASWFVGLGSVRAGGGLGGDGTATLAGVGGRGSYGRTRPMPVTCADISAAAGDGEYLFAFNGDPQRPYFAFCTGVGTTEPRMYLTLHNRGTNQNFARYNATSFSGPLAIVTTRFQRVGFEPSTRRLRLADYAFAASMGTATGGPFGSNVVTRRPLGSAGDCSGWNSATGQSNIDLRGLPFAISATTTWTPDGFIPGGTSTFSFQRQVVDVTGGGFCGGNAPGVAGVGTSPDGEVELTYLSALPTCQAIKASLPTATDGVWAVSPSPALGPIPVTCDMTYRAGGWALVADGTGQGPVSLNEAWPVTTGTSRSAPLAVMQALATPATELHLRSTGTATRAINSTAPVVMNNLRAGRIVNVDPALPSNFSVDGLASTVLNRSCPPAQKGWPNVFHACGNTNGAHWVEGDSNLARNVPGEAIQLYVR
ncbi:MAG: hypothetical protein INH41_12745, partial [Myxococcaceae bacterium]|nr:hypothetical protein [Myxococcaceae bacterium]